MSQQRPWRSLEGPWEAPDGPCTSFVRPLVPGRFLGFKTKWASKPWGTGSRNPAAARGGFGSPSDYFRGYTAPVTSKSSSQACLPGGFTLPHCLCHHARTGSSVRAARARMLSPVYRDYIGFKILTSRNTKPEKFLG